jgi:hypothetical protein
MTMLQIAPPTKAAARLARRKLRIIREMIPTVRWAASQGSLGISRTVLAYTCSLEASMK